MEESKEEEMEWGSLDLYGQSAEETKTEKKLEKINQKEEKKQKVFERSAEKKAQKRKRNTENKKKNRAARWELLNPEEKQKIKEELAFGIERAWKTLETGPQIVIDFSFESVMNQREISSAMWQANLVAGAMKRCKRPMGINLTGISGATAKEGEKMSADHWVCKKTEKPFIDHFWLKPDSNKKIIYLSPDAQNTLEEIHENGVYVVGGLVDTNILHEQSLLEAKKLGVESRRLPIDGIITKGRRCLNISSVCFILVKFWEEGDWVKAVKAVLPPKYFKEKEKPNGPEPFGEKTMESKET